MSSAVGIGQDGAERLVQFVGDGRGQLADSGIAIGVSEFGQTLARFDLGKPPPPPLVQQPADETSLHQEYRCDHQHLPAIALPDVRLAKQDFAAGRQTGLADAPAPQFPPIISRRREADRLVIDAPRFGAAENADRGADGP